MSPLVALRVIWRRCGISGAFGAKRTLSPDLRVHALIKTYGVMKDCEAQAKRCEHGDKPTNPQVSVGLRNSSGSFATLGRDPSKKMGRENGYETRQQSLSSA
jgi:hypothetical protein